MPRVIDDTIRISIQRTGEDQAEKYDVSSSSTLGDIIRDEMGGNPAKFTIYVNGSIEKDINTTLKHGDQVKLEPLNYSSGLC